MAGKNEMKPRLWVASAPHPSSTGADFTGSGKAIFLQPVFKGRRDNYLELTKKLAGVIHDFVTKDTQHSSIQK